MPGSFTNVPGAPSVDELVARWEERTGIRTQHRDWYRAFQLYKMAVIVLVGGRSSTTATATTCASSTWPTTVPLLTGQALAELGVEEELDPGTCSRAGARRRSAAEGGAAMNERHRSMFLLVN